MGNGNYIGWDIGGAHLKVAHIDAGGAVLDVGQYPTPLWQGLDSLDQVLRRLKHELPGEAITHAVTVTGELADIFLDRKQGVIELFDRFSSVFAGENVLAYGAGDGFISVSQLERKYMQVASANWYATAQLTARHLEEGVLIDIGSSTTDLIPFRAGRPCNLGSTDLQRLHHNELVYTGLIRTPLTAITGSVPFGGHWQPLIAEYFANSADIYRLTGELDESHDMLAAADGGGKEVIDSARRLARMLGTDIGREQPLGVWRGLAAYLAEQQLQMISRALSCILSRMDFSGKMPLVGAGIGRELLRKLAQRHAYEFKDFAQILDNTNHTGGRAAECAAAVAVAQLARLAGQP